MTGQVCAIKHYQTITTRSALTLPQQTLFDDAATKVTIDQSSLRAFYSLAKFGVLDALTASEPCKDLRLVDLHAKPRSVFKL